MVLEILNEDNNFRIVGVLNRNSLHVFQRTFENVFDTRDSVVLSIEELKGIDREGVNALAKLHNESLTKHKKLSIIGFGCKEIYRHFNDSDAARELAG